MKFFGILNRIGSLIVYYLIKKILFLNIWYFYNNLYDICVFIFLVDEIMFNNFKFDICRSIL